MTTQPISALAVGDQVWAALDAIANVNTFRGRVVNPPRDPDGTVHAYAVLYETPGRRRGSRLGALVDQFDGTYQVTCVGGDTTRALWCVDRVVLALTGLQVTVPGRSKVVRLVEDDSNLSQRARSDDDVAPTRWSVPLLFRLRA